MKCLTVVFVVCLAFSACFAQSSEGFRTCSEKAKTQKDMTVCANEEAARADAELNDVYRKLLSRVMSQPDVAEKIRASERAWIVYRDAYIEAMYPAKDKQAEYGSSYPMQVNLVRAKLTQQQIVALKDLLQQYSEGQR